MFKDVETFHTALADFASDALRDVIASFLIPVSVLVPRADQPGTSLTFVGGTPTMSATLNWPIPPKPENIEDFAKRVGSSHSKHIRKALESRNPYSFIGQIDLGGIQIPLLPDSGRLLFFYDVALGSWDNSTQSAKVIWDKAPTENLVEFSPNEALIKAEADWNTEARNYVPEPIIVTEELKQIFLSAGLSEKEIDEMGNSKIELPEHKDQNVFFGPKRLMLVETQYQTPLPFNLEWENFTESVQHKYDANLTGRKLSEIYSDSDLEYKYPVKFQVLGFPVPEQDDPRYEAAVGFLFNKPHLGSEKWNEHKPAIMQEAKNWRLLFQVSLADWTQEIGEGMVYFYIRKDDLKARNFDAVVAVYQQT